MLDAGATGYILKNSGIKILEEAIQTVASGERCFSIKMSPLNFISDYIQDNGQSRKA